jgi:hypothetical protein
METLSASSEIAIDLEEAAISTSRSATIEVTFEGLMVFHKEQGDRYEVGILSTAAAPGHEFHIMIDGKDVDFAQPSSPAEKWILEIRKVTGGPSEVGGGRTILRSKGHSGRLKDNVFGQWDFDWAVDLESNQFHDRPLDLIPGQLTPIIHLPYGELKTKYKTPMVQRQKGKKGTFLDFGFVTETTELDVQLRVDEEMVLRVANPEKVIFKRAFGTFRRVAISNARPSEPHASDSKSKSGRLSRQSNNVDLCKPGNEPEPPSHFTLYYNLFKGIEDGEKYDFKVKCPLDFPFNVYPIDMKSMDYHKAWIGSMPCGKILLGQRDTTNPLK